MGDLRDDLIRLAERLAVGVVCTRNEFDANPHCATPSVRHRLAALAEDAIALRALLARHHAPSPSVSRDAETCRERSSVGHGCRREAGHEGRHRDRHGNEWAPSPRSEAPALPVRNTSTEEGRAFWSSAEQAAAEVESWPDWKRAGIIEAKSRARARSEAESGPQWMPGGAFCSCGEVEFLVPGTATVRTSTLGVALPTVHTPTECRSATWDEVSNLSAPVPAESATKGREG